MCRLQEMRWSTIRRVLRRSCVRRCSLRALTLISRLKTLDTSRALRGACEGREAGHRSCHQNSSHHAPKWDHAHGQISWEPGMRDPTYRPELGEFHAGNRQERIARPIDAAMANG